MGNVNQHLSFPAISNYWPVSGNVWHLIIRCLEVGQASQTSRKVNDAAAFIVAASVVIESSRKASATALHFGNSMPILLLGGYFFKTR